VYKATIRWMVRRNIRQLNAGNYRPVLAMFADDGVLAFPGDNSWANQFRPTERGRRQFATHRGRAEVEAFLQRYTDAGIQMVVEDVVVNGGPWRTRMAIRVHDWVAGPDGSDVYNNRAVLFAEAVWGKIRVQEDYEDTERAKAFDAVLAASEAS
jgi:hypothetical protein